ncbi:hypothetical protein LSH36_858g00008 [Paralvinella palmiformis]|uniref:Mab-21-like HhH/H2TH-like domain-containing protein n=1 Tax=Paralvinella palmiformis TaxID=53620 RepID=A0AAD9IYE7_9ANNE|nr:hypothetical protein LSH36_858g00008 [Paralvinella palmiformis]
MRYKQPADECPREFYDVVTDLKQYLKNADIITRVEYVGSGERGTWIPNSDYDSLFIKRDPTIQAHHVDNLSPYAHLKRDGAVVNARTAHEEFKQKLTEALEVLGYSKHAKLTEKGSSSLVIDYYRGDSIVEGNQLFSVDVHFCYDVQDPEGVYRWYIAMSPPDAGGLDSNLWRVTMDRAEESETQRIGAIARWAVRVMKAIKRCDPCLATVRSIVFEQTAYYLKDEHPRECYWREQNMKTIIKDMLLFVSAACRKCYLKHYLMYHNILEGLDNETGQRVAARLEWLAKEPQLTRRMMTV